MILTASFEKAEKFCESFRPQLPKVYNDSRPKEKPIPSVNFASNAVGTVDTDDEQEHERDGTNEVNSQNQRAQIDTEQSIIENAENEQENADGSVIDEMPQAENAGTDGTAIQEEQENANVPGIDEVPTVGSEVTGESTTGEEPQQPETDVKFGLAEVNVDFEDESMMNDLFDNGSIENMPSNVQHATDALKGIQLASNEEAEVRNGKVIVTKRIADDLEMVYTYGETPKALLPLYRVKLNDSISENIPFKENVSVLLCFVVEHYISFYSFSSIASKRSRLLGQNRW